MALPNGDLITTVFDPQMAYPVDKRMQVDTLNSRDSISMFIRWEGMTVYVLEDSKIYILQGGRSNEFWKELGIGSGTGGTTFVGQFATADLLPTTGRSAGDYAFVGTGEDFVQYNWDNIANQWVMAEGQTDMASEFFHIGYKTPLRRPVIFPLLPKDVIVQESGDFVFAPETSVARFIFVGEVTAIRGIETAAADREIKLVNRTGSDIPLRDKASGNPTGSGFDFGGTDYTWVNGSEITIKGNGTYWELAPNNQVAFSDHLDSVNAKVSVGSDGMMVISDVFSSKTKRMMSYRQVTTYLDGSTMDDSRVDNNLYIKIGDIYLVDSEFISTKILNVNELGAIGDSTFDNSPVFTILESILNKSNSPIVLFFPNGTYLSSKNLTIRRNVSVIMDGIFRYSGNESHALRIGESSVNTTVNLRLKVYRHTVSDWENEQVGIELVNLHRCTNVSVECRDFTEDIRCLADGRGFVFNHIRLGELGQAKIYFRGTNINSGWFNENNFYGGNFWSNSGTNPGKARTCILIDSLDGLYTGNNNNNFNGPSFEATSSNGATEILPIRIVYGEQNAFYDCRDERYFGNTGPTIRTENGSRYNHLELGYSRSDRTDYSQIVDDIGTDPTTSFLVRRKLATSQSPRTVVYNSGDISKRVCEYDATQLYAEDELFFAYTSQSSIRKTGVATRGVGYIGIPVTTSIGVRVDTSKNKRFEVRTILDLTGRNSRINIKCYDSSGNILSGSSPKYVRSEVIRESNPNTNFGGSYQSANNFVEDWYIVLSSSVSYIDVMISRGNESGISIAFLKSFTILAIDAQASIINPYSKKGLYSSIKPTGSAYEVGTLIYNDQSSGNIGWKHLGSGVWESFGGSKPIAVASNSDYTLTVRSTWEPSFRNFTGGAGNITVTPDIFLTNDQFEGVVTGGAKTFVADTGFTLRIPSGGSATVNQYERFALKFISPTEAVLSIIKPPVTPPNASTTQRGIIEQATDAEIKTGTDTERAVDPKGLKDNYLSFTERSITSTGTVAITPLTYNIKQEKITFTGTGTVTLNGFSDVISDRTLILVNKTGNDLTIVDGASVTVPFSGAFVIPNNQSARFQVYSNLILKEL